MAYDALKDPYLQAYFHLPSIRKHIKQVIRREKTERNHSKRSRSKPRNRLEKPQ